MDVGIATAGFVVGVLVGLTGMGGGALMAPFLILAVGVRPVVAVGTDLAYSAVTKAFGAWQHLNMKTVDVRLALFFALGSVPGALAGVRVIALVKEAHGAAVDDVIVKLLGVMLLVAAASIVLKLALGRRSHSVAPAEPAAPVVFTWRRKVATVLVGVVIGALVGLTSVGSGSLVAVVLLLFYGLSASRMVGTDIFHALLLTTAAGLAHLQAGDVDLGLAANILVGSIPGVILGSRLNVRVPERALRVLVAVVLLIVGLKLV